ncbi:MAG: helix-turn-helix transcriptional regulator [Thermacetogeniaceae bacterium]
MCQMEDHEHGSGQGCGCGDARGEVMKGRHEPLLQPILLLLLSEKSTHGYELHEKLAAFGLDVSVEPTTVYRRLRRFEELGLVTSQWETQDTGPARRLYEITPEGASNLQSFSAVLRKRRDQFDFIITRIDDVIDVIR